MTRDRQSHVAHVLVSLYVVEVAVALILVGLYKAPFYSSALLFTKAGAVLSVGGIGLVAAVSFLLRQLRPAGRWRGRALTLGLAVNALSLLVVIVLPEMALRAVAYRTPAGTMAVGTLILQATWPELVARSREVIAGATPWGTWDETYFVYDRELGWTVGSNRRSRDGLYFSSVEGLRSAGPNMRLVEERPEVRVALIGDSNAFSLEVPFEESWGYHLQRTLGERVQVLNLGVDGYGIDQMYLRYKRDVRRWHPDVVVVGFIEHDMVRSLAVYPFVSLGWPGYIVKPRFTVENGALTLLNVPLLEPENVLRRGDFTRLPHVEYDLSYGSDDWFWRFDGGPLLVRFLTSASPRWRVPDPRVTEEAATALNSRLLADLVATITDDGSIPLLVFLPSRRGSDAMARETIARAHVSVVDVAPCLSTVPADRRRGPSGNHYTGVANRAIAECTASAIQTRLTKAKEARPA
jgi:hypothetical protein